MDFSRVALQATKAPQRVIVYAKELLGRNFHESHTEFSDKLLYPYEMVAGDRGEYLIKLDEHHAGIGNISAEEAVAMLFAKAKDIAASNALAGRDVVVTVPPFLTQQERQALLDAAAIAGLHVVALINDGTAGMYMRTSLTRMHTHIS